MSSYKKMYFKLFNQITQVIEDLKQIQAQTEEDYISDETTIELHKKMETQKPE